MPVFISKASDPQLSPAERDVTVGWHRIAIRRRRCVYGGGCARDRAGACVCACVRDVFAIYDNNKLTRVDNDNN